MNTIRAIDFILDGLPEPIGDINKLAQNHLRELVDAYDALEPNSEDWPEWATYCILHANGLQYFVDGSEPKPTRGYNAWNLPDTNRSDFYREVDLPLGLDWRQCIWRRQ